MISNVIGTYKDKPTALECCKNRFFTKRNQRGCPLLDANKHICIYNEYKCG